MRCAQCQHELQPGWTACPMCGWKVGAGNTAAAAMAMGDVAEIDIVREALAEEYDILEELGRGGMAIVYRARERQLDRDAAIKVLPFSLAFDAEFVERFQREARTAAGLEHPNIIPIYRVGQAGRVSYFVMKFLRGHSLSTVLAQRGRLSPPEIRRLLVDVGKALGHAAQRGVVHRDIKPDNIMFDEFGACVVTDFGIAKAASGQRLTGTGMSVGTPSYMSPEQARAQSTDGRSDIYSLGVVAYQCLVGRVPFEGEDHFAIGYKHIMEPLPEPDLATGDERRVLEVVRRMLAKDPGERFQSCEQLVLALEGETTAPVVARGSTSTAAPPVPTRSPAAAQPTALSEQVASQPTTPLSALAVERPAAPGGPARRPVARRGPVHARSSSARWPWVVVVLLLVASVGAARQLRLGPFARRADSAAAAPIVPPPTVTDSADVATDSLAAGDGGDPGPSPAAAVAADSATPTQAAAAPPPVVAAPPPVSTDSGALRIVGLPAGSQVMIDEHPPTSAVTRLSAGRHVVAIVAPQHNFFTDTVTIGANQVLEYEPQLVRLGQPVNERRRRALTRIQGAGPATCDEPGAGYNRDNLCWDQRARFLQPPRIPIPASVAVAPSPSLLAVRISAEGQVTEVRPVRPSNNPEFERRARELAQSMRFQPATKAGTPVASWLPIRVEPVRE